MTYEKAIREIRDILEEIAEIYYITGVDEEPLIMAIEALRKQQTTKWNKTSEVKPTKEKQYLCCRMLTTEPFFKILYWSNNLYEVDEYDFYNCKGKSGFYSYGSEYGCYEDDCDYWKEIDWSDIE